jgi:hypothetical protein
LGKSVTGWQLLPADAPDFETSAANACELVLAGDPRIGKVLGGPNLNSVKEVKVAKSRSKARGETLNYRP